MRAEVSAPLSNDAALDGRSAATTWFTTATEDSQLAAEAPRRAIWTC